jgi:ribosome-associated protein
VPKVLEVRRGVVVPESAQRFRAVRASGPGGQNVNKVASRVELRVDLSGVSGLSALARARLRALAAGSSDAEGRLLVTSQKTRDQFHNLEDAREKVRALILRALVIPKHRRATRPSGASREARLDAKRRASQRKAGRRRPVDD